MTPPRFDPEARRRAMHAAGLWTDKAVNDFLAEAVARTPDKTAVVGYRVDQDAPRRISYRELEDMAGRVAAALRRRGVQAGDVVAMQLPNWWQVVPLALACERIGALINPLMHIFRDRELRYMLEFCGAKVLVAPRRYRGFDYSAMVADLHRSLPGLQHAILVDDESERGFDRVLLGGTDRVPAGDPARLDPDRASTLVFTSGTTGSPRAVMHSANTMLACCRALTSRFGLTADEVLFAASPVGHMTAYTALMVQAIHLGATLVLQDVWEVGRGLALMHAEGATHMAASTPFLVDMCDAIETAGAPRPTQLRTFLCGGAPIPPVAIERSAQLLGAKVCSLWGMTESLSGTLTEPERVAEKSASTDGRPVDGMEVRIVDADGAPVPVGVSGRLLVRGASCFLGYYNRPDIEPFDAEGWLDSGDVAYSDAEGYIRISGRTKDIVIRGGENVPVAEIENLLYKHPAVAVAAIVGYPDPRLGERACAFLALRPGAALDLAGVQAWMAECKVAKQYWPERVEVLEQMPQTPSGKVQKFQLRERLKQAASA